MAWSSSKGCAFQRTERGLNPRGKAVLVGGLRGPSQTPAFQGIGKARTVPGHTRRAPTSGGWDPLVLPPTNTLHP
jgi:hypothetical protein